MTGGDIVETKGSDDYYAPPRTVTTSEVAEILGRGQAAVWKMVERGTLVPLNPKGKPLRFWERDVWELEHRRRTRNRMVA